MYVPFQPQVILDASAYFDSAPTVHEHTKSWNVPKTPCSNFKGLSTEGWSDHIKGAGHCALVKSGMKRK